MLPLLHWEGLNYGLWELTIDNVRTRQEPSLDQNPNGGVVSNKIVVWYNKIEGVPSLKESRHEGIQT